MSIRFRRTVKIAPGVRLNVTKSGLGLRLGPRGVGVSAHSSGRVTASAGLPGSGLYYRQERRLGNRLGRSNLDSVMPIEAPDIRRLRKEALRDYHLGGGPSIERLWELTAEAFGRSIGALGAELAAEVGANLNASGRQAIASLLAELVPSGTSPNAVSSSVFDRLSHSAASASPNEVEANLLLCLKELPDLNDGVERLAEKHLEATYEVLSGLPFAGEWAETLERDAPQFMIEALFHELCIGTIADELAADLGEPTSDAVVADVVGAFRLLSLATPSAARRAAVLAGRALRVQHWPTTQATVKLRLADQISIEIPVGTTAASCAALRAAHLLGESAATRGSDLNHFSTVELLVAVHDLWIEGATDQLMLVEAPTPNDDVSTLVCVFLAAGIARDHPGDALGLLDAAIEGPASTPILAESLLQRAWVRRTVGDKRFADDVALLRELAPGHSGLWAYPDLDTPAADRSPAPQLAHDAAADLCAAVFPSESIPDVQSRARSLVSNVIGRVMIADGELSLREEELWGSPAYLTEVSRMVYATKTSSPEDLLRYAVQVGVDYKMLKDFVDAVVRLGRYAALVDGEVDVDEHSLLAHLRRVLEGQLPQADGGRTGE